MNGNENKLVVDQGELTGALRESFRAFLAYWSAHRPVSVVVAAKNDDGTFRELTDFEMASFLDHCARNAAQRVTLLDEDVARFLTEVLGA